MTGNQDLYRLPEVAAVYAGASGLLPPEETILRLLLPDLRAARMLDLGVGGGRTTLHFADHVREYVGADYSESMIRECQSRFAAHPTPLSFVVADARSLQFPDASFDFILFSLNGIDSVNHSDRLTILKEIRRVGKPGGWFCFSTHNLNFAAPLFDLRQMFSRNPRDSRSTARRLVLRFVYNWRIRAASVKHSQYMLINERAHAHRFLTYHIRPEAQLAQLRENFSGVRVFSFTTGSEITDSAALRGAPDMCLYYLCRIGY